MVDRIIDTTEATIRMIMVKSAIASSINFQNGVGGGGSTLFLPKVARESNTLLSLSPASLDENNPLVRLFTEVNCCST